MASGRISDGYMMGVRYIQACRMIWYISAISGNRTARLDSSRLTPSAKALSKRIGSGRNRIVRRIFESLGYRIRKLDRVYFAGLTKKGLRRGQWRFLTEKEIGILKMMAFE